MSKNITTLATVAAQSGKSRIVLVLFRDDEKFQLKIQEMQPGMFQVGSNFRECQRFFQEQEKLVVNLKKQTKTPVEGWMDKYNQKERDETSKRIMTPKRKLVYMCMGENVQACWKGLLTQLDTRSELLLKASQFYEQVEVLRQAIERTELHVQKSRQILLLSEAGQNVTFQFNKAKNELKQLNQLAINEYKLAKRRQEQVIDEIIQIARGNLGDMRPNHNEDEAQALIRFFENYLKPLELRQMQLKSVISSIISVVQNTNFGNNLRDNNRTHQLDSNIVTTKVTSHSTMLDAPSVPRPKENDRNTSSLAANKRPNLSSSNRFNSSDTITVSSDKLITNKTVKMPYIRDITNFNDLNLVEDWLRIKIDQLNSNSISSLGSNVVDSRSILAKHEQIALECRTIEEATLKFNGKSIHAIKVSQLEQDSKKTSQQELKLFERQKVLSSRVTDVIAILDIRIVLLRRTIDFYQRSIDATGDIVKLLRRLQVDNSLQAIHFVSNELELGDVSSVVASGATILSELQQLQLAQQHGQRPNIVHLNLATTGIREVIEEVNKDLAHLKAVLNQRKLVLMNEDSGKMSSSFANKCQQLHIWLRNEVKCFLITNERIGTNLKEAREYCDSHQQLRLALQNKLSEVEALLRSLPALSDNLDPNKSASSEIQRAVDDLRLDWIQATNCLDRRLELVKSYISILTLVGHLTRELECLDKFNDEKAIVSDTRSEDDINASVEQLMAQLETQAKQFTSDAETKSTALSLDPSTSQQNSGNTKSGNPSHDLNKQQLIDHVNGLLRRYTLDRRDVLRRLENQRSSASKSPAHNSNNNNRQQQRTPTPTHMRPQLALPPRFTRTLLDRSVEPFSTIELECETDSDSNCRVDWFMNNFKPIPVNFRYSKVSDNNTHRLIIRQFSPICCGTYIAQASNKAGSTVTQCKLQLRGIKENAVVGGSQAVQTGNHSNYNGEQRRQSTISDGSIVEEQQQGQLAKVIDNESSISSRMVRNTTTANNNTSNKFQHSNGASTRATTATTTTATTTTTTTAIQVAGSNQPLDPAVNGANAFRGPPQTIKGQQQQQHPQRQGASRQIERIIQGVQSREDTKSPSLSSQHYEPARRIQFSSDSCDTDASPSRPREPQTSKATAATTTPASNNNYNSRLVSAASSSNQNSLSISYYGPQPAGQQNNNRLQVLSPMSSAGLANSRSVSKSPAFEGTPEAPVFVQPLTDELAQCSSRAGLVCLVVGNPPPKVEWFHNNNLIAATKCQPKQGGGGSNETDKANLCTLTIETLDDKTTGQYVCRARNNFGESMTKFNLIK